MEKYPDTLDKKMSYISEHLVVMAGATVHVQECDSLSRMPYLNQWFCNSSGVLSFWHYLVSLRKLFVCSFADVSITFHSVVAYLLYM
jgi:hypothetical protein